MSRTLESPWALRSLDSHLAPGTMQLLLWQ